MNKWVYVKTRSGHEGQVLIDDSRPAHEQVSDQAVTILYGPHQITGVDYQPQAQQPPIRALIGATIVMVCIIACAALSGLLMLAD